MMIVVQSDALKKHEQEILVTLIQLFMKDRANNELNLTIIEDCPKQQPQEHSSSWECKEK